MTQPKRPLDRKVGEARRRPFAQIHKHAVAPKVTTGLMAIAVQTATASQPAPNRATGAPARIRSATATAESSSQPAPK